MGSARAVDPDGRWLGTRASSHYSYIKHCKGAGIDGFPRVIHVA